MKKELRKVRIKVVGRVTHWMREDRSVYSQLDFDGVPNEKGVVMGIYEKVDLDALYEKHFGGSDVVVDSKEEIKEKDVKNVPEKELVEKVDKDIPVVRRIRREGTSLRSEQRRRKKQGLSRAVGRPNEIDWDSIKVLCLERYNRGDSVVSICKEFGISVSSFYRVVIR